MGCDKGNCISPVEEGRAVRKYIGASHLGESLAFFDCSKAWSPVTCIYKQLELAEWWVKEEVGQEKTENTENGRKAVSTPFPLVLLFEVPPWRSVLVTAPGLGLDQALRYINYSIFVVIYPVLKDFGYLKRSLACNS